MRILAKLSNRMKSDVRFSGSVYQGHDLSIPVNHQKLVLRCHNHALTVTPEALATAFLIPALSQGRRLVMDAADDVWYRNQEQVQKIVCDWWGYAPQPVLVKALHHHTNPPVNQVGLAFSLGVDSMYSCFFAEPRPNLLVLVGGFDVPLGSKKILDAMVASTKDIAQEMGMDWALVETNIRENYLFRRESWDRSHGAAVAFVGMALSRHIGSFLISSGFHADDQIPWGSHPDLDHLHGTSYLNVIHAGANVRRIDKIKQMISHPVSRSLFKKHVRVCWENPSETGNCGYCSKCVLLRLSLLKLEPGFRPDTMPNHHPLAEIIKSLPPILNAGSIAYRKEVLGIEDPAVNQALIKHIERSEAVIAAMDN
ncbi:MAG: hypothetical protein ACK5NE_00190 [Brachymonas sp.]